VALTTHPHDLAPRLKKRYSYTSTVPRGLHVLLQGDLHLYLTAIPIYYPTRSDNLTRIQHGAALSKLASLATIVISE
jgi:hypothetical protein